METPGARIKERRLALNLTLEEVARACGVARSTAQRWENGMDMRREKLPRLAEVLGTTVGYILGITDEPATPPNYDVEALEQMRGKALRELFRILLDAVEVQNYTTADGDWIARIGDHDLDLDTDTMGRIITDLSDYFLFLLWKESR